MGACELCLLSVKWANVQAVGDTLISDSIGPSRKYIQTTSISWNMYQIQHVIIGKHFV